MKPQFPLKYDELIEDLKNKGSFSFEYKIENKDKLRIALGRLSRAANLAPRTNSFLEKLRYGSYSLYVDILHSFIFDKDEGAHWAASYYRTALHHIEEVRGSDLDETTASITFIARS